MNTVLLSLEMSLRGLRSNVIRSILTVLGIVIGIAAVIAVMAIGNGAQQSVISSISNLGSNVVTINAPRGQNSESFDKADLEYLNSKSRFPYINYVSPVISVGFADAALTRNAADDDMVDASISGVGENYFDIYTNIEVLAGETISNQDITDEANYVILGYQVWQDLLGGGVANFALGQTVYLNNTRYTVSGILAEQSGSGFNDPNSNVYIPYSTAAKLAQSENFSSIVVGVDDGDNVAQTQAQIEERLAIYRGFSGASEADFSIFSPEDILSTATEVTGIFTVLLTSVASISLLVGGIGISNIMLVSVTERTKEIGLRKAIGARKMDVLLQFLLEAILLTGLGGILGILLGYAAAALVSQFGGLTTMVTLDSVMLATSISVLVGLLFGFFPARQAAQLNPIDALRYE